MKTKYAGALAIAILLMVGFIASGTRAQEGTTGSPDEPVFISLGSFEVTEQGVRPIVTADQVVPTSTGATAVANAPASDGGAMALTGTQPWVTLMCKFSDFADEPHDLAWYQGMYSDTFPGLGHYFNEASFGQMSLSGSTAAGWFTLPNNRAHYTWPDGSLKGAAVILDCISAADPTVNFVPFAGITVMVNTNLGNFWTAGALVSTLDGEFQERMITAAPLAVYANVGSVAMAMSTALHMHPSWGDYGGVLQYDVWNAVASGLLNCSPSTAYGCTLQHADMVNRDHMDWVLPERKYSATTTGDHAITLEQTAQSPVNGYVMAEMPLFISRDYGRLVIEARRQVGYDVHLPGNAIIIHRDYYIENAEFLQSAPHLIEVGSGAWSNDWAMWTVGETYVDTENGFEVSVDSATATGFVVTLTRQPRGQIIVKRVLQNSVTSQSFGFDTSFDGAFNLNNFATEHKSDALVPGTNHSVTATTIPTDWELTSSVCDDGSSPAAIDLADGERVTCTFHYLRQPSDIVIRKVTVPSGSSQLFNFSSPQFSPFSLADGQNSTRTFLTPGTYSVSEINIPVGWELDSATCDNGDPVSAITVDYGEVITCTFTNEQLAEPDLYEPNGSTATATAIAYGQTKTGAYIFLSGDVDYYKFSANSGDKIIATVMAQVNGSSLDSFMSLRDDFGPWTSNNNSIGTDSKITFTIPFSGNYYLVVSSNGGSTGPNHFYSLKLELEPPPAMVANFSADPTSGTAPLLVNFTDQSTSGPTSWAWTFGDGGTSTQQHPSHTYTAPGDYTVSLTATNAQGSDGETKTDYINVTIPDPFEPNNTPAQFTTIAYGQTRANAAISPAGDRDYFRFSGSAGDVIEATVLAQVNGSLLDSVMTLYAANGTTVLTENDDMAPGFFDSQISFTLATTGNYYLRVRNWDEGEGSPDHYYDLQLEADAPPPPTAAFSATPLSGNAPLLVSFTDQSTGSPTSWAWTFGDGGTSTLRNPTHTYTTPGVYTVSLTATNAQGSDPETKTSYITVNTPPATPSVYVVSTTAATVGGVAATPQDILFRDGTTGTWSMYFDGSDVGVTKPIVGFARLANGNLLLALKANQSLPTVGAITTWDVVRFIPTSTGPNTAGTYAWYVDGSDVGLSVSGEKIDALDVLPDGRVLISVTGAFAVPKVGGGTLKAQDEDIVALTGTFGATTTGTWAVYFDGTAVTGLAAEDVTGAHANSATGDVYITVLGSSNVGGVSGNGKEIFKLAPTGGGSWTVTKFWNGATFGFNLVPGAVELP